MQIMPNSLTISQLFSSTNEQFVIPAYQRRYSWRERQIWELVEDIKLIEATDTHLLGSIVCLTGHHAVGLNKLELVDGQQRLTTISIILECIRQRLEADEELQQASDLSGLLSAKPLGGKAVRKIALDSRDGAEFDRLISNQSDGDVTEFENKHLQLAFGIIRGWIAENTLEQIGSFLYKLRNHALIIRLDVSDAKDAFKLFETINNRGLKLSPTDIIKNFVLGNAARFGASELNEARASWAKLITHLDGTDTDAFFRYFLIASLKKRVTKSKVVPEFKTLFMNDVVEAANLPDRHLYAYEEEEEEADDLAEVAEGEDVPLKRDASAKVGFKAFINRVVQNAKAFGDLVLAKTGDKKIDRHLLNLRMIKAAQTYGFLMYLRVGGADDKQFVNVLKLTEGFILRRHICRERANETETLFAKLCTADPKNAVAETRKAYREACPPDDRFKEDFAATDFSSSIDRARYCLEKIELLKHGNHSELQVEGPESVHVEHIIPQKIKTKKAKDEFGDWVEYLGDNAEAQHLKLVSNIGNLTLFAGTLNISASNNPFASKKAEYKKSGIEITKEIGSMPNFRFKQILARSKELAELAVEIWPTP
jgi:Protein of unknown function DUF262/Protein of unknown function (DUF1524)